LDNNILAMPSQFELAYSQLRQYKLKVDFNQGLDMRLMDNGIVKMLSQLKYSSVLRIAWDRIQDEQSFDYVSGLLLRVFNPRKIMVYILVGYDTVFSQDVYRLKKIRSCGFDAFVMPYHKKSQLLNEFSRWNNRFYFRNLSFNNYLSSRKLLYLLPPYLDKL